MQQTNGTTTRARASYGRSHSQTYKVLKKTAGIIQGKADEITEEQLVKSILVGGLERLPGEQIQELTTEAQANANKLIVSGLKEQGRLIQEQINRSAKIRKNSPCSGFF